MFKVPNYAFHLANCCKHKVSSSGVASDILGTYIYRVYIVKLGDQQPLASALSKLLIQIEQLLKLNKGIFINKIKNVNLLYSLNLLIN